MQEASKIWVSGDTYEHYMGRWSALICALFLDELSAKTKASWLDVGCGTGTISRAIAPFYPRQFFSLDLSFDFIRYASRHSSSNEFINADAVSLPFVDNCFDVVVSGLTLNFIAQPDQAAKEFQRVAKPGGRIAAYVWDYAGKMEFLRYFWEAAVALKPKAKKAQEAYRFPICQPNKLKALWESAGLQNVSVEALVAPTFFEDFDADWRSFSAGKFPAPQYLHSLDEKSRQELREYLQAVVPIQDDGSIRFIARAWAVYGEKAS